MLDCMHVHLHVPVLGTSINNINYMYSKSNKAGPAKAIHLDAYMKF